MYVCVPEAEQCSSFEWPTDCRTHCTRTHSTSKQNMITFSKKRLVDSLVDVLFYRGKCANTNDVAKVKCVQFLLFSLAFFFLAQTRMTEENRYEISCSDEFIVCFDTHYSPIRSHTLLNFVCHQHFAMRQTSVYLHWLSEALEDSHTAVIFWFNLIIRLQQKASDSAQSIVSIVVVRSTIRGLNDSLSDASEIDDIICAKWNRIFLCFEPEPEAKPEPNRMRLNFMERPTIITKTNSIVISINEFIILNKLSFWFPFIRLYLFWFFFQTQIDNCLLIQ